MSPRQWPSTAGAGQIARQASPARRGSSTRPWRRSVSARRAWPRPAAAAGTAKPTPPSPTPRPPRLVAIGGLSGTGKSTLASAIEAALGPVPGARVLRSDVLRKLLFGSPPESPLPAEAYTRDIAKRVYRDLCLGAVAALRAGYTAAIDAVALREDERRDFAAVAAETGARFTGLWLEAPADRLTARVQARIGDASDASPAIVAQQLAHDPGVIDWVRIDASAGS